MFSCQGCPSIAETAENVSAEMIILGDRSQDFKGETLSWSGSFWFAFFSPFHKVGVHLEKLSHETTHIQSTSFSWLTFDHGLFKQKAQHWFEVLKSAAWTEELGFRNQVTSNISSTPTHNEPRTYADIFLDQKAHVCLNAKQQFKGFKAFEQKSLHYTPEHCLVNGGFPLFWWKKPCFKWAICIF